LIVIPSEAQRVEEPQIFLVELLYRDALRFLDPAPSALGMTSLTPLLY
jgi:hypothetical protein